MSPTLITERGYRIVMYLNDHEPAHVHVKKAGHEARVQLSPVHLMDNWGYNNREINVILEIVEKYQDVLLEAWVRFFPDEDDE
ncbi:MAG: DUF4160 domain-containing protein [Anaerolineae bacterium]|nr:DUF4160 domain-containing protein [Anaerolineae bacterium]